MVTQVKDPVSTFALKIIYAEKLGSTMKVMRQRGQFSPQ